MKKLVIAGVVAAAALVYYAKGFPPFGKQEAGLAAPRETGSIAPVKSAPGKKAASEADAPAVTVVRAATIPLKETILVTGTLVPRLEVLVAPEVEGLRVVELLVEEGDRVAKGQALARLESETLSAQLAQSEAGIAKAGAAIAQARSNIEVAEARLVEARNALDRARPLGKSGVIAESTLDQREAAARTATAQLKSAQDGLRLAEADLLQLQAQKRDITWRLSRTEVRAPVAGVISRRSARLGALGSGAAVAQPMFHMIADGHIELEADVPETDLVRLNSNLGGTVTAAGGREFAGIIRLVSPEVDRTSRLGKIRISLPDNDGLRIGSFARASVVVREGRGVAVPTAALLFGADGAYVQIVTALNRVESRKVAVGMQAGEHVEIASGLKEGEVVIARSGTFLRAGDLVRPVPAADRGSNGG